LKKTKDHPVYEKSSADKGQIMKFISKEFSPKRMLSLRSNPNLKYNYFEKIDTLERAYWLGFIFADGHISKNLDRFRFKLSIRNKEHLENFCRTIKIGFENIKTEISIKTNKKYSVLSIYNQKFIRDLLFHKVVPSKTKIIELPELNNQKLYLAFLLGYYDGDGTKGTSRIKSASKKFLVQIQSLFEIKYQIKTIEKNKIIRNFDGSIRVIKGKCYALFLGSKLFNEMIDNYEYSLKRKRFKFSTNEERILKIKQNAWKGNHEIKLQASREEIEKIIYIIPKSRINLFYGVSGKTISNWCKKWNIKSPTRGDRAKIHSLKVIPKSKEDWRGIIDF